MKIEFFCTYPGVLDTWPIEPISRAIPNWVRTAKQEYVANKSADNHSSHIFRCNGIGELYKQGYVVRAWHDFTVQATREQLKLQAPTEHLNKLGISIQHADTVSKFLPHRLGSCKSIIKCNTPWHLIAPCKFLMLPVAYSDNVDFEACIGILDPSVSTEINVQLYWNRFGDISKVKAGTPLCHLIPITEQTCELIVREKNENDTRWLEKRHYIWESNFVYNIQKMKELYKKFWK